MATDAPRTAPSIRDAPTSRVGDALIRTVKMLHAVRQHAPRQHPNVDPLAYPLLFNLAVLPRRLSDLAEAVHADVSTTSRQVSSLVDLGFVTRTADPDDGRAQVLALTDEGHALLHAIRDSRDEWLQGLLADWSPEDLASFSDHLTRFASVLEADLTTLRRDR